MHLPSLWLGAFKTYLFLGLSQVLGTKIDESLVCRICSGYQICGRKHSQTPDCLNGIPCTVEQYRLCEKMADTIVNQKCDHSGIFPDSKCPSKYYTCDSKKNSSSFDKRTWTCPAGKTFDPVTKHCLNTDEKRMLQVVQTLDRLNNTADVTRFVCRDAGIFPDPHDCKMYHSCNTKLESQDFYCSEGTYFNGVNCKQCKTKQCLSQLEKNSQNQLKQGEEIYTRIRELLAIGRSTELENSLQDTAGTKYTHFADGDNPALESANQTLKSMWDLQNKIRNKIRDLQKMSEWSFLDLQKLQDTITAIANKITQNVKIVTDYMNEKICSKMKKLADEDSLTLTLSLCNNTYNTGVRCHCHQDDNGSKQNWTNLSTHYTILVPLTSTQTTQSLQQTVTTINTPEHKLTVMPHSETITPKSHTSTIRYNQTEIEETTHRSSSNSIQQEQTSNYHETEQTTSPKHETTTSVSHNEYDENEEITSVKHETTITEPHINDETHVEQAVSSQQGMTTAEYPTVKEETHNGNTTIAEHTTTTVQPYSETTFYADVYSSVKDEYTESDINEEKTSPVHEPKTTESPTESTLHFDVHTDDENDGHETLEKQTSLYQKTTTEHNEYDTDDQNNTDDENYTENEYDMDDMSNTDVQYDYDVKMTSLSTRKNTATEFNSEFTSHSKNYTEAEKGYETQGRETSTKYISAAYGETTPHMDIQTTDKEEITTTQPKHRLTVDISDSESSPRGPDIQDTEKTFVPKPTAAGSYSKTVHGGSTSGKGLPTSTQKGKSYRRITSAPNSAKNKSQSLNPKTSTSKDMTTNHFDKTVRNYSTSTLAVPRKGVIAKTVTTEMTLSTSLMQTLTTAKPPRPFRCLRAGYFTDPEDCHSFYRCSAVFDSRKSCHNCNNAERWKLVGTHHTCKNGRWFSRILCKCVKFKPLLC